MAALLVLCAGSVAGLAQELPGSMLLEGETAPEPPVSEAATGLLRLDGSTSLSLPDPLAGRELPREATPDRLAPVFQQMDAGNWAEAITALRPILREEPENRGAHMAAVYVFLQLKRDREAMNLLETMLTRWPNDFRIINNLAWLCATASEKELRDVHRGMDLARDAVLRTPADYRVWSTLAECYYVSGDFDRAVDTMRKASEIATLAKATQKELDEYREQLYRFMQAQAAFRILR